MNGIENRNRYETIVMILHNVFVTIGFLGIVSNILAFIIFMRKTLRNTSYAFYSRMLALSDIVLLLHSFRYWFRVALDLNIDLLGPLFCRLNEFQPFMFGSVSSWLRTLILFDRLVRMIYRHHLRIMRRKWFQFTLVSIILVSSALLHLILPLNYRLEAIVRDNSTTYFICYIPPDIIGINFMIVIINISICSLLTFLFDFKLISFMLLPRYLLRSHQLYYNHRLSAIKDRKFAISSIIISLVSFVCLFTFGISTLIALMLNLDPDQVYLVYVTSVVVSLFNASSMFFINMFMNSIFQNEFLRLIGLKKQRRI